MDRLGIPNRRPNESTVCELSSGVNMVSVGLAYLSEVRQFYSPPRHRDRWVIMTQRINPPPWLKEWATVLAKLGTFGLFLVQLGKFVA